MFYYTIGLIANKVLFLLKLKTNKNKVKLTRTQP